MIAPNKKPSKAPDLDTKVTEWLFGTSVLVGAFVWVTILPFTGLLWWMGLI